ncbi:MAG: PAS domain S-box protein, partial [Gemmatimonadaceae bacterium]|nr:PAS domain S-box protein [Gemmatimonadaceae bacterium]
MPSRSAPAPAPAATVARDGVTTQAAVATPTTSTSVTPASGWRPLRFPIGAATLAHGGLVSALLADSRSGAVVAAVGGGMVTALLLARQARTWAQVSRLQGEQARAAADARLAALVRQGSDMVTVIDAEGTIRFASPSHRELMGHDPRELLGRDFLADVHAEDRPLARRAVERLTTGASERESIVMRLQHANGAWHWIDAVGSNHLADPSIGGIVFNSRDVTDRKRLEARLVEQAVRDPLTGLGNRRLFGDRVQHALARRARHG